MIAAVNFLAANDAPANLEAEQALLGAILYDNEALQRLNGTLRSHHFSEPFHASLFQAILDEASQGRLAEPILIADRMAGVAGFHELGGIGYLANLVDRAPPAANAPDYARQIFDFAVRRDVLTVCSVGSKAARDALDVSAFDIVSDLRSALERVENDAAPDDATMIDAPAAAEAAVANMREMAGHGRTRGRMTGLRCIDRRLNGLKPGALIVVGGRPGMGKTALARAAAHGAAVRNPNHLFLFLGIEMGPEEMMQRELSALTCEFGPDPVEYRAMGSGALTASDFMVIDSAQRHVPPNLILDDCSALSIDDVRRKVWSLGRRGKIGAVFIDYLQLMRRPIASGRNEASVLGEMTQALKQIARQAGIAVVLLSQLSRAVEHRDDKRPQLSDLRESGSIEQDADAVLFPFREFYYVFNNPPKQGSPEYRDWEMRCEDVRRRLDVICGKQRQGPQGTDEQRYLAEYDYIEDVSDKP